jgi:hypothetical protein
VHAEPRLRRKRRERAQRRSLDFESLSPDEAMLEERPDTGGV